jgi:hypothetical protein
MKTGKVCGGGQLLSDFGQSTPPQPEKDNNE